MGQRDIFGTVTQDKAISPVVGPLCFRDMSDAELAAALLADTPGAESEFSLRENLSRHPNLRRENTICSWGERIYEIPA